MIILLLLLTTFGIQAQTRQERADERVVEQEMRRMQSAKRRKAVQVEHYLRSAQRQSDLLARTAAIEAWQDRTVQKYEQDISFGKYAHLYPVPAWPLALHFFNSPVQCKVEYAASRAHRCCDESGSYTDLSYLVLGSEPKVKDLLLASAMTTQTGVTAADGKEFLSDLADTPLLFTASQVRREVALSCALSMRDNTLTVGMRLPFVEHVRNLRVWPKVDEITRALLRNEDGDLSVGGAIKKNATFRDFYGINTTSFITDAIERKGMRFDERVGQFDVGDIQFFATASLFPKRVERCQIGMQLTIPTAKQAEMSYFYPLQPGNGGFISAKAYAGLLGKKTTFGSPHCMTALTIGFPATVTRRVPRQVTLTSATNLGAELFGEDVSFSSRDVSEPETTIAAFAQQTAQVTLRPGMQVDMRCGTVVMPLVVHGLQGDLYYHLNVRAGDRFYKGLPAAQWYTDPLVKDGLHMTHSAGLSVSYQPDAHVQLQFGLESAFAGIRTPLSLTGTASLSYEW